MGMNPRLLRPRQTIHPDAASWASRVVANGGSVSATTFGAVDRFCKAITSAGIRDRFYRLNLFCGASDASLNAVRTPLYRGPSLGGTQFGNAMDTNVNFVQGDYAEGVGLTSNGTTKHLRVGTLQSVFGGVPATGHMSCRVGAAWPGTTRRLMGVFDLTLQSGQPYVMDYSMQFAGASSAANFGRVASTLASQAAAATYLTNRSSSTSNSVYLNGSLVATSSNESINRDIPTIEMTVFGASYYNWNTSTGTTGYESPAVPLSYYSFGASMTASQVSALHTAITAFNTALGRA